MRLANVRCVRYGGGIALSAPFHSAAIETMAEATTSSFHEFDQQLAQDGPTAALDLVAAEMKQANKPAELYEVLKMRARLIAGLPLLYSDHADAMSDEQRTVLEEGLLSACREVGKLLLKDGRVVDAWMYLQYIADREESAALIAEVEPDEDNIDQLVQVLLAEGVDPERGYQISLDHFGTCNSITAFHEHVLRHDIEVQRKVAVLLVRHLHEELSATLIADIAQQEGSDPAETTLAGLLADRDWVMADSNYHIDTTHLSSTVVFGRLCEDKEALQLALDLCAYGKQLGPAFAEQKGDEPFADVYPSHTLYFQALLGENEDAAVEYFRQKAEELDTAVHSLGPIQTYLELLVRLGRREEALTSGLNLIPVEGRSLMTAAKLFEFAESAEQYERLADYFKEQGDILGYAAGKASAQLAK